MSPNPFQGFDIKQVRDIAKKLKRAEESAGPMVTKAKSIGVDAVQILSGPQAVRLYRGQGSEYGAFTPTYRKVVAEWPKKARDIEGRAKVLEACEKMYKDFGYTVDPVVAFGPGRPPDPKNVKELLEFVQERTVDGMKQKPPRAFSPHDGAELLDKLKELNAAELDAFLNGLSKEQLERFKTMLGTPDNPNSFLNKHQRIELANMILGMAGPDTRKKIMPYFQGLHPAFQGDSVDEFPGLRYGDPGNIDLFPPGQPDPSALAQGKIGDCYFLASLGGVAQMDPDFIKRNIRENPNGTYTVTFYDGGEPVEVTVTGDLPMDGSDPIYADPSKGLWVAIYEKAYAQFRGSYGDLELPIVGGDLASTALEHITGKDVDSDYWHHTPFGALGGAPSLDDLRKKLADGETVVLGSHKWPPGDNKDVVPNHQYIVEEVFEKNGKRMVRLRNPWGPGASLPETVELTEEDFQRIFVSAYTVKTK